MNEGQGIVGQVRPAQQLIQRAAQDEGEVGTLLWRQSWRVRTNDVHRYLSSGRGAAHCVRFSALGGKFCRIFFRAPLMFLSRSPPWAQLHSCLSGDTRLPASDVAVGTVSGPEPW